MSHRTAEGWSLTLQAEASYAWWRRDATTPGRAPVGKAERVGPLPIRIHIGPSYHIGHFGHGPGQ